MKKRILSILLCIGLLVSMLPMALAEGTVCPDCGNSFCTCDFDLQFCEDCGYYPCECETQNVCPDCGSSFCTCEFEIQICEICGCSPCECGIQDNFQSDIQSGIQNNIQSDIQSGLCLSCGEDPCVCVPVPSVYEKLMAAASAEEMYGIMSDTENYDALMALTAGEISALAAYAETLPYEDPDYYDLVMETLTYLPNSTLAPCADCGMTGGHAEDCPWALAQTFGTWADDMTIKTAETISTAQTIANNDTGGEANWGFENGSLTIKATVTIPKNQSLDLLVYNNDSDDKGVITGTGEIFVVSGRLKIAKTNNNDGQNYGSIELRGGTIRVKNGGTVEMEDITTISGDTKIIIEKGGSLVIHGDVPVSGKLTVSGTGTIERTFMSGTMFLVEHGGHLVIKGNSAAEKIILDGNKQVATMALIETSSAANSGEKRSTIDLDYVEIRDCKSSGGSSAAISISGRSIYTLTMDDCVIDGCVSRAGSALYLIGGSKGQATLNKTIIQNCESGINPGTNEYNSEGGTIRTNGNTGARLTMEQCIMKNNRCGWAGNGFDNFGGCVYWNACAKDDQNQVARMVITDCQFIGNYASHYGGAIFNETFMDIGTNFTSNFTTTETTVGNIRGTLISGNKTDGYGGGIEVPTYAGGAEEHYGTGAELTLGKGVFILNNEAKWGGGIAMKVEQGSVAGDPAGSNPLEHQATVKFEIKCEGAVIQNNKAEYGGGVYLEKTRDLFPSTVNLVSGTIANNTATADGGAIYVKNSSGGTTKVNEINIGSSSSSDALIVANNTAATNGGAIYISGGDVKMYNGTVKSNTATNGGAVYVTGGSFTMSGGTMGGAAEADANTAAYGGAAYVNGGNFTMTSGTLQNNAATADGGAVYLTGGQLTIGSSSCTGTHSHPVISDNSAVNGGAIAVAGSNLKPVIHCGTISGNEATANGGALYIADSGSTGKLTIYDGTFNGNQAAANGGSAYITGGGVDMHGGVMQQNQAHNGGAVYVNGGNFNMISGKLIGNTAVEETTGAAEAGDEGYGGAVYAASGNIYVGVKDCTGTGTNHTVSPILPHPVVESNTAVFGGGFAVNGGSVYIYCGSVKSNTSDNDGTGMNVYMTGEGSALYHYLESADIGEDEDHGMVSVGGTLTIVHGENDQFIIQITYFSNSDNLLDENGVQITWIGTAPEGYFLNLPYCPEAWQNTQDENGYTFVGWTKSPLGTTPDAVREKDDYLPIGTAVKMEDLIGNHQGDSGQIHFYAVWAPKNNDISYQYVYLRRSEDGTLVDMDDPANAPSNYTFQITSADYNIPSMSKDGYTFQGWAMYANYDEMSNWDKDPATHFPTEPKKLSELGTLKDQYLTNNQLQTQQNFGNITLVAVFVEDEATIDYQIKMVDGSNAACGTINPEEEKLLRETEASNGCAVSVEDGFIFVGWYESDGTTPVNAGWVDADNKLTPVKDGLWPADTLDSDGNVTPGSVYIALFDYAYADLTIMTTGMPANQSFIFTVTGTPTYQSAATAFTDLTVAINGNGSVTIKDVPVGDYKVTEADGWTWRYATYADQDVALRGQDETVTFSDWSYKIGGDLWLSGLSFQTFFGSASKKR